MPSGRKVQHIKRKMPTIEIRLLKDLETNMKLI